MKTRLLVGLGNPGPEYSRTRHNAGFLWVDRLLAHFSARPVEQDRDFFLWSADTQAGLLFFMKPTTYMNLSGRALAKFLAVRPLLFQDMLIGFDDVALPLGQVRLRPSGSSGGQKGLQNIIDTTGTRDIPRLRLGIRTDAYDGGPLPDFVLGRFDEAESVLFERVLDIAVEAVDLWLKDDFSTVMGRINGRTACVDPVDQRPSPLSE